MSHAHPGYRFSSHVPANLVIFLVNDVFDIRHVPVQLVCHVDAAGTGADGDYPYEEFCMDWSFGDRILLHHLDCECS